MSIGVPGNNPYVISVGAFTDDYTPADWSDDYITPFSATGPTLDGFVKPDVIAPGAHMVSTMQSSANLAKAHEAYKIAGNYFSMAGTSQATAVVSGIAALILSQDPLLTPDQVKYRIMHTALLWSDLETGDPLYSVWQQGAGRVNAPDAVLATTTESANYGLDIQADLAGIEHYEGFTYYDETTDKFRLHGDEGWPESYGTWDGGYSTWAGGYSTWAGGYSTWAGGYSTWAGGYSTWAGSEPWINRYGAPAFVATYASGESPDAATTSSSIGYWIEEREWDGNLVYMPFALR
jgi:serine protease AprX